MQNDFSYIFDRLSKSKFRSSFKLSRDDIIYVKTKGLDKIRQHAYDFVNKRLKDITKINDGHQTPTKGHPVFVAQHSTATCCRGCLEKWHNINRNKILSQLEVDYVVEVIMEWIKRNLR